MKKVIKNSLVVIVFLSGLSLLLYPLIANEWNNYRQRQLITTYDKILEEQQEAIESIHTSLGTISEMVESNAASAQENTAISQQLADCAKILSDTTEEFSLQ